MQSTRWEILQLLKRHGRATVQELAKELKMTLMGVRLHLVVVERDGYVRRGTLREKPGRPAMVYSLTPRAEELFPKRYDLLAESLLEAIQSSQDAGVGSVLAAAAHGLAAPFIDGVKSASVADRVDRVGRALDEIGGFASLEETDGGRLIHQYNCLYYRVADRRPEVCGICERFLEELLGEPPQRRASLVEGAGRCTYFVPNQ